MRNFVFIVFLLLSAGSVLASGKIRPASALETISSGPDEPELPTGLRSTGTEEPDLPAGLDRHTFKVPATREETFSTLENFGFSGFWETRVGLRTQTDQHQKQFSIGETRLQTQLERYWPRGVFQLTTDLVYDPVHEDYEVDLERGTGFFDLRNANLLVQLASFMDVKLGRQILTWGTGDLLFINDLFPKDWNSFFIGRDVDYLKAPSDSLKLALFSGHLNLNLDFVYTPRFDPDRFIDGSRISFFDPRSGTISGRDAVVRGIVPDRWFRDDEIAWRLYRTMGNLELAGYGYRGFWKSPAGFDPGALEATFPRLSVYGASILGTLGKGLFNLEFGYYDSRDDSDGDDPSIRNSELRFLVGYQRELARDFQFGTQYYLERMLDYDNYRRSQPSEIPRADENRHVVTLRLTRWLMGQNLKLSLFSYFSPSDTDAYLRPNITYRLDDNWSAELGANVFKGSDEHTFFGQFEHNSNVYIGVRYSFPH